MKTISYLFFLCLFTLTVKSQTNCSNFKVTLDKSHFTNTTQHDSAFVRCIQFDVSNTTTVSKIGYTFSNASSGGVIQTQNYSLTTIPSSQNLTVANNCLRAGNTITISLGYLGYMNTNYSININLYDSNNNLLGTGSFNFHN
ncbi:MAG TPA: hypothetical protein VK835_15430 [Bacteroidia bacterium]|jgi:hypothetical protein|nr:hypothetical protein [Bacteroidia bacterium]